jgi:hypothetical protein
MNMNVYDRVKLVRGKMRILDLIVILLAAGVAVVASPGIGHGYVGPGAGFTLLGSLWAVVAAVITAIAGILIWLFRALFRLRRRGKESAAESGLSDT